MVEAAEKTSRINTIKSQSLHESLNSIELLSFSSHEALLISQILQENSVLAQPIQTLLVSADQHISPQLPSSLSPRFGDTNHESSEKESRFSGQSVLIDLSRGAVYKPDFLQLCIDYMGALGANSICLYTETFEGDSHFPLPNYREVLVNNDIRLLTRHGKEKGVLIYPAIQTLAHMERLLQFPEFQKYSLNGSRRTIDPSYPGVYEDFIIPLVASAAEPYRAEKPLRMNIGCDESTEISPEIFAKHLWKMRSICQDLDISPEIWADQVLTMSESDRNRLPKDIPLIYWEYDEVNPLVIEKELASLKQSGFSIRTVSASAFTHNQFFPDTVQARKNIQAVSAAGQMMEIPEIMLTIWHDDGAEAPMTSAFDVIEFFFDAAKGVSDPQTIYDDLHPIYDTSNRHLPEFITPNPIKIAVYEDPTSFPYSGPIDYSLTERLDDKCGDTNERNFQRDEVSIYYDLVNQLLRNKDSLHRTVKLYNNNDATKQQAAITLQSLFQLWIYHKRLWSLERYEEGFKELDRRYLALCKQLSSISEGIIYPRMSTAKVSSYPNAWRNYDQIVKGASLKS